MSSTLYRAIAIVSLWALVGCAERTPETPPAAQETASADMDSVFHAFGNEPSWHFEIQGDELHFTTADSARSFHGNKPAATIALGSRRYVVASGAGDFSVTISDRVCTDSMSGMPYPYAVVVEFAGQSWNGCGGDPASLLQGAEWIVQGIAGSALVAGSSVSIGFGADGNVSGPASCNRYSGPYTLSGEGLTFASFATTRMACEPSLMEQEERFLVVLSAVQRFEIAPDGTLILHAADGRTILARRN